MHERIELIVADITTLSVNAVASGNCGCFNERGIL